MAMVLLLAPHQVGSQVLPVHLSVLSQVGVGGQSEGTAVMSWWVWVLIALGPGPGWLIHVLIAKFFLWKYGYVKKRNHTRWVSEYVVDYKRDGAGEIVRTTKGHPLSRIWFQPGAQTHFLHVFYKSEWHWNREDLRVHEFTHGIQALLFGMYFVLSYLLWFGVAYVILFPKHWVQEKSFLKATAKWVPAYMSIPWEVWARWRQRRFNEGQLIDPWGADLPIKQLN